MVTDNTMTQQDSVESDIYKSTGSDRVDKDMVDYMKDIRESSYSHVIDGLTLVQRRILLTLMLKDESKVAFTHIGRIKELHVHGEGGIFDAMVRLMQDFIYEIPFIDAQGNCGSYIGDSASAMRYLECQVSSFSRNMFMKGINTKTLKWIPAKSGAGVEVEYFIPKIPLALFVENSTPGIGYSSRVFPHRLNDICKAVEIYAKLKGSCLSNQQEVDENEFMQKYGYLFVPSFPIAGFLRNQAEVIDKRAFRTIDTSNRVPMLIDGDLEIHKNYILVNTLPPYVPFGRLLDPVIKGKRLNKKHWFNSVITDAKDLKDKKKSCFKITFKNNIDIFSIIDQFKKEIAFTRTIRDIPNFLTTEKTLAEARPFQIMELWYKARFHAIFASYKYDQRVLNAEKLKWLAMMTIKDRMSEVVEIAQNSQNKDEQIQRFAKTFGLKLSQATVISNMTIAQLSKDAKADIPAELDVINNQIAAVKESFNTIPDRIVEEANEVSRKYISNRPCTVVNHFSGRAQIGEGVLQIESIRDLTHYVKEKMDIRSIMHYPLGKHYRCLIYPREVIIHSEYQHLPKESSAKDLITSFRKPECTVIYSPNGAYRMNALIHCPNVNQTKYFFTNKDSQVIYLMNDGSIEIDSVNRLPLKKSIIKSVTKSDSFGVCEKVSGDYIILTGNIKNKNCVWINVFKEGKPWKLDLPTFGENMLLAAIPINRYNDYYVELPEEILNRKKISGLEIVDVKYFASTINGKAILNIGAMNKDFITSKSKFIPSSLIIEAK